MLSKLAKLLMVSTAFAPVLLTLGFLSYVKGEFWPSGLGYLVAAAGMGSICHLLIRFASSQLEILPFRIKSIKTADKEILAFVLAYLLPFASTGAHPRLPVVLFVIFLLFLVVWTTHSYHFNPILGFFKYHFYEVTAESNVTFILVTRRTLRECEMVTQVVQLTDYIVLDAVAM